MKYLTSLHRSVEINSRVVTSANAVEGVRAQVVSMLYLWTGRRGVSSMVYVGMGVVFYYYFVFEWVSGF